MWAEATGERLGWGWGSCEKSWGRGVRHCPPWNHMNLSVAACYRGTPSEPPLTAWYVDSACSRPAVLSQKGSTVGAGAGTRKVPHKCQCECLRTKNLPLFTSLTAWSSLLFTAHVPWEGACFFTCFSRGSKTYCDYGHFLKKFLFFIYLFAQGLSCGIWDLVPCTGIEPGPLLR